VARKDTLRIPSTYESRFALLKIEGAAPVVDDPRVAQTLALLTEKAKESRQYQLDTLEHMNEVIAAAQFAYENKNPALARLADVALTRLRKDPRVDPDIRESAKSFQDNVVRSRVLPSMPARRIPRRLLPGRISRDSFCIPSRSRSRLRAPRCRNTRRTRRRSIASPGRSPDDPSPAERASSLAALLSRAAEAQR
jgi:hypothetical protein